LGELLADADLERIDRAEGGPDRGPAQAHRRRGQRVEAEPAGEQEENRDERNDLLLHVLRDPAQREGEDGDRDDKRLPPA